MLIGAHAIIYSEKPDLDRTFFRQVLNLPNVDVGQGWLIFGLPPAEIAVHPADANNHEIYLMCDDVGSFIDDGQTHDCLRSGAGRRLGPIDVSDVARRRDEPEENASIRGCLEGIAVCHGLCAIAVSYRLASKRNDVHV